MNRMANSVGTFVFAICLLLIWQMPCGAELADQYLEREFDWAMFADVQDVKNYLNYRGSQLHPLSKIRIHVKKYPRAEGNNSSTDAVYEEFWYQKGVPVGSRRISQLNIDANRNGAIVIGPLGAGPEKALAAASATLRLTLDLQFKQIITSVVLVPRDSYTEILSAFEHYRFYRTAPIMDGKQMSIHIRSYPAGMDQRLYLQK